MVYHPSSNSAQHAQDETQTHAAIQGYAWQSGAAVSLGSSSTSIETTIDSGTVLFNGQLVDVSSTTNTHSSGDSADPRWDAVVVTDNTGTVEIISGPPAPPAQTDDGTVLRGEEAWSPAPEDTIGTDLVILALVWIPSGATATADLTDTSSGGVNEPIVDRRLPAPGRAKQQYRQTSISSSGWYRIASNGPVADGGSGGDRAHAMFTVHSPQSAVHTSTSFYASVQYGNQPTLTLLNRSGVSDGAVQQVRLVSGGSTEGAAVEVYIALGGQTEVSVDYSIYDNNALSGWTPVAWQSGNVPSGFTTTGLNFVEQDPVLAAAANGSDDMFVVGRDGSVSAGGTGVRAHCSSDFTVSPSSLVKMPIDRTRYDDWGALDATNNEIIIPSDGTYACKAQIGFRGGNSAEGDNPEIQIQQNGNVRSVYRDRGGATYHMFRADDDVRCTEGDALSAYVNIADDAGNTREIRRYDTWTFFAVSKMG